MPLSKCARCGKIFSKIVTPVCPKCEPEEDADYAKIHNVISKHAGLKAEDIAEKAGVAVECVMRMLMEGRLRFAETNEKPTCGRCGAPAISMAKRLCEACLVELDRECASAMRDLQKDMPRGVQGRPSSVGSDVLGEKRAELEKKRTSEALKRAAELEERAHPSRGAGTVAREAREKKGK